MVSLNKKNIWIKCIILIVATLFISGIINWFHGGGSAAEIRYLILNMDFQEISFDVSRRVLITRTILGWIIFTFIGFNFIFPRKKLYDFCYKKRFFIGIGIILLGIVLSLNGSSIACWSGYVAQTVTDTIIGTARLIRSDEWATMTPMILSQSFGGTDAYSWFSQIIRGDATDVFMIYALPVKTFWIIFRPFLAGYLLLGSTGGLSFFWFGRVVCLWLVSFEFFMLMTKKNKKLSLVGAMMITFAPVLQWWFAINALVEMLIFGMLFIIMLHRFMSVSTLKKRIIPLILMYICAGGYVLTLYPSWMVPLAYVFLVFLIWVIKTKRKDCIIHKRDILAIFITLCLLIVSLWFIFSKSWDTIQIIMNTAYPGSRVETGGNSLYKYGLYVGNMFFSWFPDGIPINACETAVFFAFAPINLILAGIVIIKEKQKDLLLILMLICYVFLSIWCVIGFPEILAKVTLLSNSQSARSYIAVGLLDVFILIRAVAILKVELKKKTAVILAIIVTAAVMTVSKIEYGTYLKTWMLIAATVILFIGMVGWLLYKKFSKPMTVYMIVLMLGCGLFVNPLQAGTANVYSSDLAQEIQTITDSDDGLWLVDSCEWVMSNYLIMMGASTINSTNVYPDLERWEELDPTGEYNEVYNRYAHIKAVIDESSEETFQLLSADLFQLNLTNEDVETLNIKYILTTRDMTSLSDENVTYEMLYESNGYYIFEVE